MPRVLFSYDKTFENRHNSIADKEVMLYESNGNNSKLMRAKFLTI
jgi:hypothetical protein